MGAAGDTCLRPSVCLQSYGCALATVSKGGPEWTQSLMSSSPCLPPEFCVHCGPTHICTSCDCEQLH